MFDPAPRKLAACSRLSGPRGLTPHEQNGSPQDRTAAATPGQYPASNLCGPGKAFDTRALETLFQPLNGLRGRGLRSLGKGERVSGPA